jgi:signal transduction histidine kinase/ligand-binding sensor domain-containing protein
VSTWTTGNALPQGVVYAMTQTRDGSIWFTTLGGLVRYDGVEFTVFERATLPGIRSNRFVTLIETSDGTLWAGTEDGFVTRYQSGEFTSFSVDGSLTPVLGLSAEGANLWVSTSRGLFRYDGARFLRTRDAAVTGRFLYLTGTAAIGDAGVYLQHPGRPPDVIPFPRALDPDARFTVRATAQSTWIVHEDRGIFELRDGKLQRFDHPLLMDLVKKATTGAVGREAIGAITRASDGAFWISESSRGVARVDERSVQWITPADGLAGVDVSRIFEDRDGTIWVATRGTGISALRLQPATTYGAAVGLSPPNVYPILSRNGQLLVGSWGGGVYRFDGARFTPALPSSGFILSLADGGDDSYWVSAHDRGVARVRGADVRSFTIDDGLPSLIVPAIYRARDGRMWFGTSNGLATLTAEETIESWQMPEIAENSIQTIAEDRDGSLLLGTRGGLLRFRDGRATRLALAGESVRAIHIDDDGTLWIGTYDRGLHRIRNGRAASITSKNGLWNNGVFAIVAESEFFWMSSNRGLHRAARRELEAVADGQPLKLSQLALTEHDGLLSAECNGGVQPSFARTADGRIWFPSQRGIVALDPRLVSVPTTPLSVQIHAVSVDGERVPLTDEIRIGPESRRLELRFVAPSTVTSVITRYRYRLEGFETEWNEIVGDRVAAYTSLPPGRYRFLVTASNAAGQWSQNSAALGLRVLPPFWRTWWFITAMIAAALLILVVVHRSRMRVLERERAAQAEFSHRLLTQQEEERKRVASELHDSLGQSLLIIKNRALLGMDGTTADTAAEQLEEISETASSAIDEVRRIAHNLRPVELDHLGLTRSLEVLLSRMSSSSPILFSGDLEPIDTLLPKMSEVNMFRIVQEWLSNVARHSKASAAVVSLRREGPRMRLRIQDDGAGFSAAQAAEERRAGIGLRSIAERVEMLGGTYDIRSTPGEGTALTVEVPLR